MGMAFFFFEKKRGTEILGEKNAQGRTRLRKAKGSSPKAVTRSQTTWGEKKKVT